MGRSRALNVPVIMAVVRNGFRGSVVDLGIGNGIMAVALKNFCEWPLSDASHIPEIVGVESFDRYRNPLWDYYDRIVLSDVAIYVQECEPGRHDMALLIDVIEHFSKHEGEHLLDMLLEKFDNVIVATPDGFMPQGAEMFDGHVNDDEEHLSGWKAEDFSLRGMTVYELRDQQGVGLVAVKSKQPIDFKLSLSVVTA